MSASASLPAKVRRSRHQRGATRWIVLAIVAVVAIVVLLPFGVMVLNAFKSPQDYASSGPLSLPSSLYFGGLTEFWTRVDFPQKFMNSLLIAVTASVGGVLLSLLNAYALGIGRVRGRTWIIVLFLLANMLPHEAMMYPLYFIAKEIGLYNTQLSVAIIMTVIRSAFGTYLLASVLSTFPRSLLEAAALDGASRWQVLWRVVFPIARPTLSVLLVFFFIWTWNEFFFPLVLLVDNTTQTIPVALASLTGQELTNAPLINAGALISMLPTIVFFLIFQRTLARGITAGSVK